MATTNNSAAQAGTATKKRGQFKETWRRLKKNRMAMIGLTVVVFLVLISIFADVLFDYDTVVIKQNTQIRLQGPAQSTGWEPTNSDVISWPVWYTAPEYP